jgi:glucose/arabinose dehydrogenase
MKYRAFALIIPLAFATACNRQESANDAPVPPSATRSAAVATAPPPPAPSASAAPTPSARPARKEAPHEGVTAKLGAGKVRVSAIKAGHIRVWLLEKNGDVANIEGTTVHADVAIPGYPEITLEPDVDHFEGKGPQISVEHPMVTVRVDKSGKTEAVRLKLHLESGPEGHHHHG